MSKQFTASADRTNAQNEITQTIIAQLEAGVRPWSKSWTAEKSSGMPAMPIRANGEYYNGINILLCWSAMQQNDWAQPCFMTFEQAKKLGGMVRKGSKGTKVVYYSTFTKETENSDGSSEEKTIPFMKLYTVFNVEQIDGLADSFFKTFAKPTVAKVRENIAHADEFFSALGVTLRHGGDRAFYSPAHDSVQMPSPEAFDSKESYYATLGHEFIHSTGHKSRCDRVFGQRFGDSAYAFEELVAELGAAFLCSELEITNAPRGDHASYIASWIKVLKGDAKAIFTAASMASKAVAWMRDQQGAKVALAA